MKIERWFKGSATCTGFKPDLFQPEEGEGVATCLAIELEVETPYEQVPAAARRMANIIDRLFPERACQCFKAADAQSGCLVHFNNHPETTREDVDKVLLVYTEETEG